MEYPCTTPYDVFISGGGPAGALLAIHLQRFGLNVLLCGTPRRFDSLEGMTERGVLALQASHCKHALASLGPLVLRQARWSCEQFGGNREYLVQRSVFDTALWQDASLAGVDSLRGRVDRVVWQEACWQTKVGNRQIRARYWVDARGRQAPANAMLQYWGSAPGGKGQQQSRRRASPPLPMAGAGMHACLTGAPRCRYLWTPPRTALPHARNFAATICSWFRNVTRRRPSSRTHNFR